VLSILEGFQSAHEISLHAHIPLNETKAIIRRLQRHGIIYRENDAFRVKANYLYVYLVASNILQEHGINNLEF
jgi:predicted transcriptional regulator